MNVVKRNGELQTIDFNKIQNRIQYLVDEPYKLHNINVPHLTQKVIEGLCDNIKTFQIDEYASLLSASSAISHMEYGILAGRISINNHHKSTLSSFKDKMSLLYLNKDFDDVSHPLIDDKFYKFIRKNQKIIEKHIDYERDYLIDFFGFMTLKRSYLIKINNYNESNEKKVIERPQDTYMRVSIFLHMNPKDYKNEQTLKDIIETYDLMSNQYMTHATPTLFNAGTPKPSLASCFLLGSEDSIEGIMGTATNAAIISKGAGGIGIHISDWRASGSIIRGTNGNSSGCVPFLRIYNECMRAWNQGGKRKGRAAIYMEPHHADIMGFLTITKNHGDENTICRDLFVALWISDLFMERVKNNEEWSLFCPDKCRELNNTYGDDYNKLYLKYENEGKAHSVINARIIWKAIFTSQKESGTPYILYKDTINKHSMQKNIGVIKSSNLCVSGDTKILVLGKDGKSPQYTSIKELYEDSRIHNVWNGEEYTEAIFAKTGENQELLEFFTEKGNKIKCTPYHKFIILKRIYNLTDEIIIPANEVQIGDELMPYNLPHPENPYQILYQVPANTDKIISIKSVPNEDTYCFKEPKKECGVFNGMLLGNCAEIVEYSDHNEYANCSLASICLPKFVEDSYSKDEINSETFKNENTRRPLNHEFPIHPVFNYKKLAEVAGVLVVNLNKVIDKNYYPVIETVRSNMKHRPIGIGVQGLSDVFYKFRIAFDSLEASIINKKIFETIYYGTTSKSTELCRKLYLEARNQISSTGKYEFKLYPTDLYKQYPQLKKEQISNSYTSIEELPKTIGAYYSYNQNEGAPIQTKFHWESYGLKEEDLSGMWDWETVRNHINTYGVRNSLTVALMPTASTSQIMGNTECFEPIKTNLYNRTTSAGDFIITNKYLVKDLHDMGLWSPDIVEHLKLSEGSIQNIEGLPNTMKNLYKTVWEMSQKVIIDLAADRQPFVDQSQSMNLYMENLLEDKFTSMQFYAWSKGLKTGCYYIHTRAAIKPQKFTIDPDVQKKFELMELEKINQIKNTEDIFEDDEKMCLMCGS